MPSGLITIRPSVRLAESERWLERAVDFRSRSQDLLTRTGPTDIGSSAATQLWPQTFGWKDLLREQLRQCGRRSVENQSSPVPSRRCGPDRETSPGHWLPDENGRCFRP